MEEQSVFTLITRLCERFIGDLDYKNGCSAKATHLKRLRSISYGILLKSSDSDFTGNSHECFVKAISANFQDVSNFDSNTTEEFDRCIEHLWQESSKKCFLARVVYFLSRLHNEGLSLADNLKRDVINKDGGNTDVMGYSISSLPKKYHLYHPSSFILPKLEDYVARDSKCLSYPSVQSGLQSRVPSCTPHDLQLNFISINEDVLPHGMKPTFSQKTQDPNDEYRHQLEDEGYVSHGATPMGASPGGWCGTQWDQVDIFDLACEEKATHLTWESLGEPAPLPEPPSVMEAGPKALHCLLKIQECLMLTMEPSLWSPQRNSTSWRSLFQQIMYLLIGVQSECFIFNKNLNEFELLPGTWVEGISHDALTSYTKDYITMGTCFRRLTAYLESPSCPVSTGGIVQQAIQNSTRQYLNLYSGACLLVMEDLLRKPRISFLMVKSKVKGLQRQIIGLARAFGVWGSGIPIPSGVAALGHLHSHASGAQRRDLVCLLRSILNSACRAYFNLLERWVYSGEVVDEGDFFVAARVEYLSYRSRRYWTRAFSVNEVAVPEFLSGLEPLLLRCGKSVHFLKLCDQKNAILEDSLNGISPKSEERMSLDEDGKEPIIPPVDGISVSADPVSPMSKVDRICQDSQSSCDKTEELTPIISFSASTTETTESEKKDENTVASDEVVLSSKKLTNLQEEKLGESKTSVNSEEEQHIIAIREIIIEEYTKSSEALDKRYMRADWRKRRLQLRTGKVLPSKPFPVESSAPQTLTVGTPPLASEAENTKEGISGNLEDFPEARPSMLKVTEHFADVGGDGDEVEGEDSAGMLSQEAASDGLEADPKVSDKEGNLEVAGKNEVSENSSVLTENKTAFSTSVSVSQSNEPRVHQKLLVSSDVAKGKEEDALQKRHSDAESKENIGGRGRNVGNEEKSVKNLTVQVFEKEGDKESDGYTSLISFPAVPASDSPSRTPLKKVGGLFYFPHASLDVSSTEEDSTEEAEEAGQFDWPFRPVLVSLVAHSHKVDAALLKWMLVDKGLISHLQSLRAYFFLLDGEFGRRLSEDLFSAMHNKPGKKPSVEFFNTVTLNSILSHALATSTYAASDANASCLSMTIRGCPVQASVIDQLGCIQMLYDAPWPLNVVLTDEALSKYSHVLDLLLRLKFASWALEDAFMHMRIVDPSKGNKQTFAGGCRKPLEAVHNSPQFHKLHIYRHQMLNLVRAVQSYITAEVLQASGKKLEEAIAHSASLDEFYAEHVSYVKRILFGCLLNRHSETIASILHDILKLIMKFHWSLCSRSWFLPHDQESAESFNFIHPNFSILSKIFDAFQNLTDFFLKYAWRLVHHGYQAHLNNLLLMVNANNYYNVKTGCDGNGKDSDSSVPCG